MVISCGIYSFTGSSIPVGVETFQVDYFENTAGGKPGSTIEPGLDRDFTIALQDLIVNQTSLNLVNEGGDIIYSGEIVEYSDPDETAVCNLASKALPMYLKHPSMKGTVKIYSKKNCNYCLLTKAFFKERKFQ